MSLVYVRGVGLGLFQKSIVHIILTHIVYMLAQLYGTVHTIKIEIHLKLLNKF